MWMVTCTASLIEVTADLLVKGYIFSPSIISRVVSLPSVYLYPRHKYDRLETLLWIESVKFTQNQCTKHIHT